MNLSGDGPDLNGVHICAANKVIFSRIKQVFFFMVLLHKKALIFCIPYHIKNISNAAFEQGPYGFSLKRILMTLHDWASTGVL